MIVVTIDGTDRTDELSDIQTSDQLNERVDTCSFTVEKTPSSTFVPELNSEIIITRDGTRVFAGTITSVSDRLDGANTILYDAQCLDFTFDLDRRLVTEKFEDTTIDAIIASLVSTYASTFTTNNVNAPISVSSIAFNRIPVSECLRKLADLVNYQWYVDYHKDIHFFSRNAERAPFDATEGNYIRSSLTLEKNIDQIRNIIQVQGGDVPSDTDRTVKLAGNGETSEFGTQYKFATQPTVTVDGVAQTVGTEFLQDEAGFDCMWSFQQKYIRFSTGNIPPKPTAPAETNIEITGTPLLPLLVEVPNAASIAEFGEREFAVVDKNIGTEDEAIERALAEINAYAAEISEGRFQTYTPGLRSGQTIRITDNLRGIDEDFVIQQVQYRWLSPGANYDGIWDVTVATVRTVDIINILRKLLLKEEISEDEKLELTKFFDLDDELTSTDTLDSPTTSTGPYTWGNFQWGYGVWS